MANKKIYVDLDLNGNVVANLGNAGTTTVTFNGAPYVRTTVANVHVTSESFIYLQITVPNTRDLDEMNETFQLSYGNIVDNTSFDILVVNTSGGAEGNYKIDYIIF